MTETEGVIKYELSHRHESLAGLVAIDELLHYRRLLHQDRLIGQDPNRYGGLGYGNLSQRRNHLQNSYFITGSQTGERADLTLDDFCLVESACVDSNQIHSIGLRQPSSEALSHASIYQCRSDIMSVIHVHCPELWHNHQRLNLDYTAAEIDYGSVAMAKAIQALCQTQTAHSGIFCMLGHEDGIIAYGHCLASAYNKLMVTFNQTLA